MSKIVDTGSYTYELIKRALDASDLRGKAIANNIANINTKGYKRINVTFEETLSNVTADFRTKGNTKVSKNEIGSISLKRDNSTSMRADGNNVDLEVEKTNQAANTLMYNALVSKANGKLSMQKYVISGGR
ncbi:flagellar basal body rod protein FlgB [Clostridium massiliamazoniense]|uniref:flagellar basal body rod protein FlgB n=1 Tax=Clostridium massiliamazoniense TaxID=1347366 RepID=UPI000AA3A853|nr:flagellar basal body rod protein FlgB [Clostridium massiliamazoniense]